MLELYDINIKYKLLLILIEIISNLTKLTRKLFLLSGPEFVETFQNDSLANFKSILRVSAEKFVYKHIKNSF